MKYLKSSNWIYMVLILPLLTADGVLAVMLSRNHPLVVALILGVLAFAWVKIIGKFSHLPYKKRAYSDLEKIDLDIPSEWAVEVYASPKMAEYDFLTRIVELISPMSFGGKPAAVAVNPEVLKREGKTFMQIAVMREIERYARRIPVKLFALIALPVTLFIGVILFFFNYHQMLTSYFNLAALNLLLPFALMLLFLLSLFFWNSRISRYDTLLDTAMLEYFPKHEVIEYVKRMEMLMEKGDKEKSKVFNEHFLSSRVRKIEEYRKK